jgi:hypothetical protein
VSLLTTLKDFFTRTVATAGNVATNFDKHWQALQDLWTRARDDWDTFLEGRDLDSLRVKGAKLTSVVLTARDAEEVLEEFRVNRLKEKVLAAYGTIKDAIEEIKLGPVDFGSSPGQAGEEVGPMAKLMVRLDDMLTQVERILEAILSVAELFDFVTSAEKEIESKVLTQGNPETTVDGRRSRLN